MSPEPGAALISASKHPWLNERTDAKAPDRYGRRPPSIASITSWAPSSLCWRLSRANDARLPGNVSTRPGNDVDASLMGASAMGRPSVPAERLAIGPGRQPLDGGRIQGES